MRRTNQQQKTASRAKKIKRFSSNAFQELEKLKKLAQLERGFFSNKRKALKV